MSGRGLLARIASPDPRKPCGSTRSIIENLEALLNADRGTSLSSSGFGVDHQRFLARWPKSGEYLCSEVERIITEYEPRLVDVRVTIAREDSPGLACLSIEGTVTGEKVAFRTDVNGLGGVAVRVREDATARRRGGRS